MKTSALAVLACVCSRFRRFSPAAFADNGENGKTDFPTVQGESPDSSGIPGSASLDGAAGAGDSQDYTIMDTIDKETVITAPGTYYLTGNGKTISDKGITVDTDGQVTIYSIMS